MATNIKNSERVPTNGTVGMGEGVNLHVKSVFSYCGGLQLTGFIKQNKKALKILKRLAQINKSRREKGKYTRQYFFLLSEYDNSKALIKSCKNAKGIYHLTSFQNHQYDFKRINHLFIIK